MKQTNTTGTKNFLCLQKRSLFTLISLLVIHSMFAFTVDNVVYNITDVTSQTVEIGSGGIYSGSLSINSAVTYLGISYSVTSIGKNAFSNCTNLTTITIPESVVSIGEYAFSNCTGLTTIIIPESVTYIGMSAFESCTGLTDISTSTNLTHIGHGAFALCTSLKSIKIPAKVTSLGQSILYNCSSLTSIYSYITNPEIVALNINVFNTVNTSACILYVPANTTNAYKGADQWKYFANIVEMTTALTSIRRSQINLVIGASAVTIENAEIGDKIEIYTFSGVKIKEQSIKSTQTTIALSAGIYVARIRDYSTKFSIR